MKRVILFASSPRREGNSDLLAEQFAKGATEAGHQVEIVYLRDIRISFCRGCLACQKMGYCIIRDGVSKLLHKMMFADVIGFASPVYYYSINGLMKTFLDRCNPLFGRMHDKTFYYFLSAQDDDPKQLDRAFDAFEGFADCFNDIRRGGRVYGGGAEKRGDVRHLPAFDDAYRLGKEIEA